VVVALLAHPPPHVATKLYDWLDLTFRQANFLDSALVLARWGGLFAMAITVSEATTASADSTLAVRGLRRAASALRLRLFAAVVVPVLTVLVILGKGGDGSLELINFAKFAALAINIVALAQFAGGTLAAARAEVVDLARWPLLVASAGSFWCAGVMLAQLPSVYHVLYGDPSGWAAEEGQRTLQAFSVVAPFITIALVAIVASVIGAFASRRSFDDLRTHASGKGVGFVALMGVSLAIANWMLPKATSTGSIAFMVFAAAGCALWANVLMIQLCTLGADAIDREPGIPTAKIVSSDAP
jgi:hypothetical protein